MHGLKFLPANVRAIEDALAALKAKKMEKNMY